MSKIICDVCGTTYPETAAQCPICGSAKPENPSLLETREPAVQKYTHVKGGRFSEKNVRKRNKEKAVAAKAYAVHNEGDEEEEERERSNVGLIITIIVLLLAIFAVVLYLYFNYFAPDFLDRFQKPDDSTVQTTTAAPEQTDPAQTTTAAQSVISCTAIHLTDRQVVLSNVGDGYLLNYSLEPADTTDEVVFSSSDPNVATVDANGKITAVSPGGTVITVTCGSAQTQIGVTCDIVTEPPTEETTVPETEPPVPFALNRSDFTMKVGESWKLYEGPVGNTEITWRTSDHNVATVVNGRVKAVGKGKATITAEYNGEEYECIVRVSG